MIAESIRNAPNVDEVDLERALLGDHHQVKVIIGIHRQIDVEIASAHLSGCYASKKYNSADRSVFRKEAILQPIGLLASFEQSTGTEFRLLGIPSLLSLYDLPDFVAHHTTTALLYINGETGYKDVVVAERTALPWRPSPGSLLPGSPLHQ